MAWCRSSGLARNAIRQFEQNASHLLEFLFFERDDVVVDLDGTERLQEETRAAGGGAMDDTGYRGSVFRADDQHVTSVAIGDDLLLKVLRRVTPPQESVERRAKLGSLFSQAFADPGQRRAGIVGHLAG